MSVSFNPKEALAFIAKSIVLSAVAAQGIPPEQAKFASSIVEGIVKGIGYQSHEKSIYQQLNDTIRRSVESILHSYDYEIPSDCVDHLMAVFSFDNAIEYLQTSDPLSKIKTAIDDAFSSSKNCDTTTLPMANISEAFLCRITREVRNNHELSALITLVQAVEINKKLDILLSAVNPPLISRNTKIDTPEYIKQVAIASAAKYAANFSATLFSEQDREDRLRLCDVYVDPIIVDSSGTVYDSFNAVCPTSQQGEVILVEGEAGSGKSSLLMRIAAQYSNGAIFQGRTLFFVRGKDICHSTGNPIDDILRALELTSIEALDDALVFLDAYDEISYAASSSRKNQDYLNKLLLDCNSFSLVITSRSDYIKTFSGLRFQLKGFSPEQRQIFLSKYNDHRSQENRLPQNYIDSLIREDSFYEDGIYELLSIPMLLYMIVVRNVNISEIADKFDLYELVFAPEGKGALHSRGKEQKIISKKVWDSAYSLALSISKNMFLSNESAISEASIQSVIDSLDIPTETKEILKNRFGIEIFLSGSNSRMYTFVHRSIYEYFTAKGICAALKDILNLYLYNAIELSDVIDVINNIFPADYYSQNIFYYVMYAINRGYVIDTVAHGNNIGRIESMFHDLLTSQLCISGSSNIPYIVRLKNLILWVFNTFSVMFGMLEIDKKTHWVKINHSVLQYVLRIKEPEDTLMICHCDLRNVNFRKYNFGSVYFIDNDLTGAVFSESNCTDIVAIGQVFHSMEIRSADFWQGDCANFSFDRSDLRYSDFRGAVLDNVSFRGADLRCCHFAKAVMYGADFTGAHIYLEDFDDALFDVAAFDKAIIYDPTTDDPESNVLS